MSYVLVVIPPWPGSVAWYNQDGKIEDGDEYQLLEDGLGSYMVEIKSIRSCDAGDWKCIVTSFQGSVGVSTCFVDIEVPNNYRKPRFMEPLKAILTEEGLVSFECKVVGFPTPALKWYKDEIELRPGDIYQLTGINSLGSYCCIAENCMGSTKSTTLLTLEDIENQLNDEEKSQLLEDDLPPKFIQGLKNCEGRINENLTFTVSVHSLVDTKVYWFKDENLIESNERCVMSQQVGGVYRLEINPVEISDQAEWKCIAMNDYGQSMTSCYLKLIIPRHFKKPRFLDPLKASLTPEGAVNLECKVIGVPQPQLRWYKDGNELKAGDIHRIITGQEGARSLGLYTCEASNCMGVVSSSASLLGYEAVQKSENQAPLERNLSLSTINEERTSQLYETPPQLDLTVNDRNDISYSIDGKEISISLYETPDLTEEEALKVVEMYADQISEHVSEQNVAELPPLRFMKETSTSGNLLLQAVLIDVAPDYFPDDEEMKTDADMEDISIVEMSQVSPIPMDNLVFTPIKDELYASINEKSENDYFSLIQSDTSKIVSMDQNDETSGDFQTAKIDKSSESGIHTKIASSPETQQLKITKDFSQIKSSIEILNNRIMSEISKLNLQQKSTDIYSVIQCFIIAGNNLKSTIESDNFISQNQIFTDIQVTLNDYKHALLGITNQIARVETGTLLSVVHEPFENLLQNLEDEVNQSLITAREKQQFNELLNSVRDQVKTLNNQFTKTETTKASAISQQLLHRVQHIEAVVENSVGRLRTEVLENKISLLTFADFLKNQIKDPLIALDEVLVLGNTREQDFISVLCKLLQASHDEIEACIKTVDINNATALMHSFQNIQKSLLDCGNLLDPVVGKSLYPMSTEALLRATTQNNIQLASNLMHLGFNLDETTYEDLSHIQSNFNKLVDYVISDTDRKESLIIMELLKNPVEEIIFFLRLHADDIDKYLLKDLDKPIDSFEQHIEACETLVAIVGPTQNYNALADIYKLKGCVRAIKEEIRAQKIEYNTSTSDQIDLIQSLEHEVRKCLFQIEHLLLKTTNQLLSKSVLQNLLVHVSDISNNILILESLRHDSLICGIIAAMRNLTQSIKKVNGLLNNNVDSDIRVLVRSFVETYGLFDGIYNELYDNIQNFKENQVNAQPVLGVVANLKSCMGRLLEQLAGPMEEVSSLSEQHLENDIVDDQSISSIEWKCDSDEDFMSKKIQNIRNQNETAIAEIAMVIQQIEMVLSNELEQDCIEAIDITLECFKKATNLLAELEFFLNNFNHKDIQTTNATDKLVTTLTKEFNSVFSALNKISEPRLLFKIPTVLNEDSGSLYSLENLLISLIDQFDCANIKKLLDLITSNESARKALLKSSENTSELEEDLKCSEILRLAEELIKEKLSEVEVVELEQEVVQQNDDTTTEPKFNDTSITDHIEDQKCENMLNEAKQLYVDYQNQTAQEFMITTKENSGEAININNENIVKDQNDNDVTLIQKTKNVQQTLLEIETKSQQSVSKPKDEALQNISGTNKEAEVKVTEDDNKKCEKIEVEENLRQVNQVRKKEHELNEDEKIAATIHDSSEKKSIEHTVSDHSEDQECETMLKEAELLIVDYESQKTNEDLLIGKDKEELKIMSVDVTENVKAIIGEENKDNHRSETKRDTLAQEYIEEPSDVSGQQKTTPITAEILNKIKVVDERQESSQESKEIDTNKYSKQVEAASIIVDHTTENQSLSTEQPPDDILKNNNEIAQEIAHMPQAQLKDDVELEDILFINKETKDENQKAVATEKLQDDLKIINSNVQLSKLSESCIEKINLLLVKCKNHPVLKDPLESTILHISTLTERALKARNMPFLPEMIHSLLTQMTDLCAALIEIMPSCENADSNIIKSLNDFREQLKHYESQICQETMNENLKKITLISLVGIFPCLTEIRKFIEETKVINDPSLYEMKETFVIKDIFLKCDGSLKSIILMCSSQLIDKTALIELRENLKNFQEAMEGHYTKNMDINKNLKSILNLFVEALDMIDLHSISEQVDTYIQNISILLNDNTDRFIKLQSTLIKEQMNSEIISALDKVIEDIKRVVKQPLVSNSSATSTKKLTTAMKKETETCIDSLLSKIECCMSELSLFSEEHPVLNSNLKETISLLKDLSSKARELSATVEEDFIFKLEADISALTDPIKTLRTNDINDYVYEKLHYAEEDFLFTANKLLCEAEKEQSKKAIIVPITMILKCLAENCNSINNYVSGLLFQPLTPHHDELEINNDQQVKEANTEQQKPEKIDINTATTSKLSKKTDSNAQKDSSPAKNKNEEISKTPVDENTQVTSRELHEQQETKPTSMQLLITNPEVDRQIENSKKDKDLQSSSNNKIEDFKEANEQTELSKEILPDKTNNTQSFKEVVMHCLKVIESLETNSKIINIPESKHACLSLTTLVDASEGILQKLTADMISKVSEEFLEVTQYLNDLADITEIESDYVEKISTNLQNAEQSLNNALKKIDEQKLEVSTLQPISTSLKELKSLVQNVNKTLNASVQTNQQLSKKLAGKNVTGM